MEKSIADIDLNIGIAKQCPCTKGILRADYYKLKNKARSLVHAIQKPIGKKSKIIENLVAERAHRKSEFSKEKKLIIEEKDTEIKDLKLKNLKLEKQLEAANSQISQLKRMIFGKKNEKSISLGLKNIKRVARKRGNRPGKKGHGRTTLALPAVEEVVDLCPISKRCRRCHLEYQPMNQSDDSEVVEISVKAYKRVIKRLKYKRHNECECYCSPKFKTADLPPKCISKGKFGSSIYANLLVSKFGQQIPVYRLIKQYEQYGIKLSQGTITGGFKTLLPLLEPIYEQIIKLSQKSKHWHVDETSWKVFKKLRGKKNFKWYLWVYCNPRSSVYVLNPSRSHKVPEKFFENITSGWVSSDRYGVYNKITKGTKLINAFCWVHVRRDFLNAYLGMPKIKHWALRWIKRINELFSLNKLRSEAYKNNQPTWEYQLEIEEKIANMKETYNKQLDYQHVHDASKKILRSLKKHWYGLITFVGMPEIPMSNNYAESALRGPVVGRKNYYGSGSLWSAKLTAIMFSIIETLKKWEINPIDWLTKYFDNCAKFKNKPPWWLINDSLPWEIPDSSFRCPFSISKAKLLVNNN